MLECLQARRDRYILPVIAAAAIVTAWSIQRLLAARQARRAWPVIIHFVIIGVMACGFPLLAAFSAGSPLPARMKLLTTDGRPWLTPSLAIAVSLVAAALLAMTIAMYRRRSSAAEGNASVLVAGTVALMLLFNVAFLWGYRFDEGNAEDGPAAVAVAHAYPEADFYYAIGAHRPEPPAVMLIYLDHDVHRTNDPAGLPASDWAQVLIYPPDFASVQPPLGFAPVASAKFDSGLYRFFVRVPDRDIITPTDAANRLEQSTAGQSARGRR
jgi:hypothetical protein